MKGYIYPDDYNWGEHHNTIDAHNWLVNHIRSNNVGIRGRYLGIRILHHMHGFHKQSKIADFISAMLVRFVDGRKQLR